MDNCDTLIWLSYNIMKIASHISKNLAALVNQPPAGACESGEILFILRAGTSQANRSQPHGADNALRGLKFRAAKLLCHIEHVGRGCVAGGHCVPPTDCLDDHAMLLAHLAHELNTARLVRAGHPRP